MSQNTRATADWIREVFDSHGEYYAATDQIAAEMDKMRDQLNKVAEAVLRMPWGLNMVFDPTNLAAGIQARVDAGEAQLAEARQLQYQEHDRVVELRKELNAARAEAERLRPAAEAFGWWENYASNPSTTTWDIFQTAAQRAREARK